MSDSNIGSPAGLTSDSAGNTSVGSTGPVTPTEKPVATFTVKPTPYRCPVWHVEATEVRDVGWDIQVTYSMNLTGRTKDTVEVELASGINALWHEQKDRHTELSSVYLSAVEAEDEETEMAAGISLANEFARTANSRSALADLCERLDKALENDQTFHSRASRVDVIIDTR